MTVIDDFSPMVDQGDLEPSSGLLTRMRRRQQLSPVGGGFVRVLIDEDGAPILVGQRLTGGEKRWSRARTWIKVDVGRHTLEYHIPFTDPTGRAGFVATVTVSVQVRDPADVAQHGTMSVKGPLESALRRMIADGSAKIQTVNDVDPTIALITVRQHADKTMREAVHGEVRNLSWLSAEIESVTVGFDDATRSHHAELVDRTRRGELIDANAENEKKEAAATLGVRKMWRDNLLPQLRDPSRRVFEAAFANPTEENLTNAVTQVNNAEFALLTQGLEILKTTLEKDFVDKDDPVYTTIKAISGKLEQLYLPGSSAALPHPEDQGKLKSAETDDDHRPKRKTGDRDWTNP